MPLLVVELEPVLVSFGRFYDIFVIFLTMRLFWWCDIFLPSLILYGDFCHLFEATTFLPFSGISYFRGEKNFRVKFAKILSEKLNQVR